MPVVKQLHISNGIKDLIIIVIHHIVRTDGWQGMLLWIVDASFQLDDVLSAQQLFIPWNFPPERKNNTRVTAKARSPLTYDEHCTHELILHHGCWVDFHYGSTSSSKSARETIITHFQTRECHPCKLACQNRKWALRIFNFLQSNVKPKYHQQKILW